MRTVAFWLSLIFVFIIPWENLVVLPGLGTVGRAVGMLVALFWLATVLVTRKLRQFQLFHFALVLFVMWNVASLFWTVDVVSTSKRITTYAQLLGLAFLAWDLYGTKQALKAGLQAYILGAYVTASSTLYLFVLGGKAFSRQFDVAGFNVNTIGTLLALGMPLAWYLGTSPATGWQKGWRTLNFAYIPIAFTAIILTSSRSAFASALVTFGYMLLTMLRLKRSTQLAIVSLLLVFTLAIQPFLPQESIDRLAGTTTEVTEGDLNGRAEIWSEGIAIFMQHPLIGVGSNSYSSITPKGKKPHNIVFSLLVELGVIGFGLFLLIFGIAVQQAFQQPKAEASLWLTVLLIWAMGALTHNYEDAKETWLFLSWVIASANRSTVSHAVHQLKPMVAHTFHSR